MKWRAIVAIEEILLPDTQPVGIVVPPQCSITETSEGEDDVFEKIQLENEPMSTLNQEKLQKSITRFRESLFRHQERQRERNTYSLTSDSKPEIAQQTRLHELNSTMLDELREADPYNDRPLTDSEMAGRIDNRATIISQINFFGVLTPWKVIFWP